MTECRHLFELLSDYIDAELPPLTCEEIRQHIEACPPCIRFVDSLRKSVELCRSRGAASEHPPPLSPELRDRMRKAYERALACRGRGG